jgi:hypothetical protein
VVEGRGEGERDRKKDRISTNRSTLPSFRMFNLTCPCPCPCPCPFSLSQNKELAEKSRDEVRVCFEGDETGRAIILLPPLEEDHFNVSLDDPVRTSLEDTEEVGALIETSLALSLPPSLPLSLSLDIQERQENRK